jgi:ADP-ribose pyrophosphatase YjhB (NUDIX family)
MGEAPFARGGPRLPCKEHKLIADAALFAGGQVLLVKYLDTARYDGQAGWFLPDDVMKEPEHPDAAAHRILYEQVGVKAKKVELGFVESFAHGTWHLIFHYRSELPKKPTLRMSEKVAEAKWFPLDKLPPREDCAHHGWAHEVLEKIAPK